MKAAKKSKTKINKQKTSTPKEPVKTIKKSSVHKKSKKLKIIIVMSITGVLIILGVLAIIFVPGIIKEQQRKEAIAATRKSLETCLSKTQNLQYGTSEYYSAKIQCYEDNKVDESSKKIEELKESRKSADLNSCIDKAHNDYVVTKDEISNAYASGIAAMNTISSRMISGYDAEIACYKTYNVSNSNSKISELETKKSELQRASAAANSYNHGSYSSPTYSAPETYNYPTYTQPSTSEPSQRYSCEDYYSIYYSEYTSATSQIRSNYNSAITNAHNSCGSFGGCPTASNLERQRDYELQQEKSNFRQKLTDVGCGDYYDL